ncbi:MAG TPA: hypothetical protein VGK96_10540 [Candidatus Sulfotelmatobacter sp.]
MGNGDAVVIRLYELQKLRSAEENFLVHFGTREAHNKVGLMTLVHIKAKESDQP